jgi:hypothetical protein
MRPVASRMALSILLLGPANRMRGRTQLQASRRCRSADVSRRGYRNACDRFLRR